MHREQSGMPVAGPVMRGGTLLFARHGATAYNLAQLRCGGDIDPPLAEVGRVQVYALAARIAARRPAPGLIVTSALARTLETARIVAAALGGGLEIVVEPGLAERRLGGWNGVPAATPLPWFEPGVVPPGGGESSEQFVARVAAALLRSVVPRLPQRPLLVGSRGIARALGLLVGAPLAAPAENAQMIEFPLERLALSVSPARPAAPPPAP